MRKFTSNKVKSNFNFGKLTQSFVSLFINWFFYIFLAFKTDSFCQEMILIILIAMDKVFTIKFLYNLFAQFLKGYHHLLCSNIARISRQNYDTKNLQKEIRILGYERNYIGHLFWRRAATSARLTRLFKEEKLLLKK